MFTAGSPIGDPHAYRAIFFEETQDHLAQVEAILLRLHPGEAAPEDLNAIFRAVHSIKGSAAMLGCADMAALAHLQENLLDVLRKGERLVERGDVQALLKAGDTLHAQALCHRGAISQAPDSAPAESALREQIARPRVGAAGPVTGPVRRTFAVALGPLEAPIADEELEMMLTGLREMGYVSGTEIENVAGGLVSFQVELEGTAMDLQSVLALLVAPELVHIEQLDAAAGATPAAVTSEAPPVMAPAAPSPTPGHAESGSADEFFVDPQEFRRRREAAVAARSEESAVAPPVAPVVPVVPEVAAVLPAVPGESALAPALDDMLAPGRADTGHIRVSVEKIDLLVNLVGELVITEAMLTRSGALAGVNGQARQLEGGLADLSRHTRNLQEAVLAIRMLPIANVFARFPRLVHELSERLGKQVDLRFTGEATELDRGLIEKISDPLTHLVRNAVDHGLETPEARRAAGKPETGSLRLKASQRGGNIVIEVSDDGRGLDRAKILARAAAQGMAIAPDADDQTVWQLIFEAGFSTADEVTDVSGRGVGMDVVRRNILALGGAIDLQSRAGQGTTVTVSVPLTLAIMEAMTVGIGGQVYVLPLATVVESLSVEAGALHTLPGQGDTLRVREEYLPVIHLARVFPPPDGATGTGAIAVIVEADGTYAALLVDELVGQQQVVVKSLEANFRRVPGLSGATVMGDGSVALILDVSHIVRRSGGRREAVRASG